MATISFQCYSCNQVLKVGEDKAGKRGKCPKCGTMLTIPVSSSAEAAPPPAAPPPLPPPPPPPPAPLRAEVVEDDLPVVQASPVHVAAGPMRAEAVDDDEPFAVPPPRRRDAYEEEDQYTPARGGGFGEVDRARLGLLLTFIGSCLLAGAFLFQFISYLLIFVKWIQALSGRNPFEMGTPAFLVLLRVAEPLDLLGALTAIAGLVFCVLGPQRRGAMPLAITTLAVAVVYLLLFLIFHLRMIYGDEPAFSGGGQGAAFGNWFVLLLVQLSFCTLFILFPLYLRALCLARNKPRLAGSCLSPLFLGAGYTAMRLIAWIMYYVTLSSLASRTGSQAGARGLVWTCLLLLLIGSGLFVATLVSFILKQWSVRSTALK
jgi:hypothetical protein